jgi:hypothetical protein
VELTFGPVRELGHAASPGEHSDRAYEHEVDDGSQGSRMLPASAVTAEPSFGPPHHERGPTVPGEGPARRGEEPPVAVLELGAPNGAAEHPHLVAEHGVLELELRHAPTSGEPSDEANKDEVGEGSQGARDATDRRQSQVFEFWSPTSIGLLGEPVGVGSPTVGAFGVEDGAVADNSSGMTGASSSLRTPLR